MRKQRTQVTEKTFNAVKIMLAGGASCYEVAEYLELGKTTVYRIKESQNWREYLNILAAMAIKQNEKSKSNKQSKVEEKPVQDQPVNAEQTAKPEQPLATNYQINRMVEEMKIMNEHLKIISNKIAFLVEQLV